MFWVSTRRVSQGGTMRLEESIVILNRNAFESPVVDLVLMVKHPEGCNPAERIHAAICDFLKSETGQKAQKHNLELTWRDLINYMNGWDWSSQALYIEEVPFWSMEGREDHLLQTSDSSRY
jgi:hypothetical protein